MKELEIIVKGLDRILFLVEKIVENQEAEKPDVWLGPPKKSHKEVLDEQV